jgi:glycosyltransferase involved in cell wall biosynthesis
MPDSRVDATGPSVTVIIPTSCDAVRSAAIPRAVDSVLDQQRVDVRLVLVVNGSRHDPRILAALRRDQRLSIIHLPQPGLQAARAQGRRAVTTEFFGFLDDDDELLPDALRSRAGPLTGRTDIDFVVTNGYRGDGATPHLRHPERIASDPLLALLEQNWLASCAGLFRTSTCAQHFFDGMPEYMEWTALAFRLLHAGRRVAYVNECTYRINDSPVSLSKSDAYRDAAATVVADLLRLNPPRPVRKKLRQMLAAARHDLSVASLAQGLRLQAWRYHLQSLAGAAGIKYLPYTRHLLS